MRISTVIQLISEAAARAGKHEGGSAADRWAHIFVLWWRSLLYVHHHCSSLL